jgi:hypothetical protein
VTAVNVDFDVTDSVLDLSWLGVVEQLRKTEEAAAALKLNGQPRKIATKAKQDGNVGGDLLTAKFWTSPKHKGKLCEEGGLYPAAGNPVERHFHLAPSGERRYYSAGDSARIVQARARGDDTLRLADAAAPDGATLRFELRFGAAATSAKLAAPPPSGAVQVNLGTGNTRVVDKEVTQPVCLLDFLKQLPAVVNGGEVRSLDVPGLFSYEAASGRFCFTLHDQGTPYGECECAKMLAAAEFTIPPTAAAAVGRRLAALHFVPGPIRRDGISFVAAPPRDSDTQKLLLGPRNYLEGVTFLGVGIARAGRGAAGALAEKGSARRRAAARARGAPRPLSTLLTRTTKTRCKLAVKERQTESTGSCHELKRFVLYYAFALVWFRDIYFDRKSLHVMDPNCQSQMSPNASCLRRRSYSSGSTPTTRAGARGTCTPLRPSVATAR